MDDLNALVVEATKLLDEENACPVRSLEDWQASRQRRLALQRVLSSFRAKVKQLGERWQALPKLAKEEHVAHAQALLRLPNLAFLALETTGTANDADILRITVADASGKPVFDQVVCPGRQTGQANTPYTGLQRTQVAAAPQLSAIWKDFQVALTSRYVLVYNLAFAQERLRDNAAHYGLEPVYLLGECLWQRAKTDYYEVDGPLSLSDVCVHIGYKLPRPATAPDRILAQLAFVQAMAAGVMSIQSPEAG